MTAPTPSVNLELNQVEAGEFVVGSSLVGGPDVIGDGLSALDAFATSATIRRGRFGALYEDFDAGSITVTLNNETRRFDPVHASGPFFGELVPGRRINVVVGGVTIVTGYVEDYDLEYDVSGRSVTLVRATDALGLLGGIEFDAWTNSALTTLGKVEAVLDRPEVAWPAGERELYASSVAEPDGSVEGGDILQSDAVSWGSNCLNYLKLIARSDGLSWLFASAAGSIMLRPVCEWGIPLRAGWRPGAPVASFGGAGIQYQTIQAQFGSETLFSEVSVDREGGTAQTQTVVPLDAWIAQYRRPRRLSIGELLLSNDTGCSTYATRFLDYYDEPTFRITEISVQLAGLSPADQTTILSIDISHTVTVTFTPNGVGSAITQTLAVQGITHDIAPMTHVVTFALVDFET